MTVTCIHQNPDIPAHPTSCTEMIDDVLKFDSKKTEQTEHRQQFPVIRHDNDQITIASSLTSYTAFPRIRPMNSNKAKWFS